MTTADLTHIRKLAREVGKAASLATRNRFLVETFLSLHDAKNGNVRAYASAKDLFRKLGV